jgi:hypothetical protein
LTKKYNPDIKFYIRLDPKGLGREENLEKITKPFVVKTKGFFNSHDESCSIGKKNAILFPKSQETGGKDSTCSHYGILS